MLHKRLNHLVGQAMHQYTMLDDGDHVIVAVSGGVDSLVLAWLLDYWRAKAPINYQVLAVHLDMGFGNDEHGLVVKQLQRLGIEFLTEKTSFGTQAIQAEDGRSACFHCARQRRNRLFAIAKEKSFNKIAFGHHREDIIETFFLNLFYSGNISTMVPRQELFNGNLTIIRPLALLDKKDIQQLAHATGITPVANPCPLALDSKRLQVRELLTSLYQENNRIKSNIFTALSNIRHDYLL